MYILKQVSKEYRKQGERIQALKEADLEISLGSFVAIQGPTGSGKSTLLQILGCLDRPSAGSIRYDGEELDSFSEAALTRLRAKDFGFVFQSFNLIPTLSASQNVETALVPLKISAKDRRERAKQALEDVGLGHRLDHDPGELSGGEQQRVAIARATVKDPRVLLADEPTGNLDGGTRDEIVDLLEFLWRDRGVTLIVVTHDPEVAARAERRITIADGGLIGDSGLVAR